MEDFNIYEELMPKIQALIAPPDNSGSSSSREKSSSESHPFFKRRGKRHNHDYCDSCGEKGNILSCDVCPASFHLLCHDPPLSGKEITNNYWVCRACQYSQQKEKTKAAKKSPVTESANQNMEKNTSPAVIPVSEAYHDRFNPAIQDTTAEQPSPETNAAKEITSPSSCQDMTVDIVRIKEECIEEKNCGSDLNESSDEEPIQNVPIKTECREEPSSTDVNLEFPLKTEPDVFENQDSADENNGDPVDVNMDDVWKIIGVDKQAKVNTDKDDSRKSSYEINDVDIPNNSSSSKPQTNFNAFTNNRVKINITLPKCDYLINNSEARKELITGTENKKPSAKKSRRTGARSGVGKNNEIHMNGIKTAFASIIKDASKMNPKQFTLPIEYLTNVDLNLIGTEKDPDSFPNDLNSSYLLKLPARKCYYCKMTCLTGQMISCDFCPAHFHLNCLNPPLCNIPDVKWMCPLHPHHVLDRVMKNPSSITELMSWWSRFSAPIDDEDVKSNFISKVKSVEKSPPKRRFIRSSLKIPDIVKYHYKHPPSRVPSLSEFANSNSSNVSENHCVASGHELIEQTNNFSDNTQGIASSNSNINDRTAEPKNSVETSSTNNPSNQRKYNLRPHKKVKWKNLVEIACDSKPSQRNSDLITNNNRPEVKSEQAIDYFDNGFKFASNGIYPVYEAPVEQKLNTGVCWRSIENFIIRDINRNFITGNVSVTTLSEDLRRLLMIEKIKQYTQDLPPSFIPNTNPYPLFHPLLKDSMKDSLLCRPKRNVRAVLCPLSHRPLVYMYGQSLSIGLGFSNDICLRHYGCCNFISDEHAVIFYDKITNTYELINYSEYNTTVDGVCYTCDISRNEAHREPRRAKETAVPVRKPLARGIKRKAPSSSIPCRSEPKKKPGSTVMAAEARSIYKKLLHDIDKLVSKSKEEMASVAEEDLNEIHKAIKNNQNEPRDRVNHSEKSEKKKKIIKKNRNRITGESNDNGRCASTNAKLPRKRKIAAKVNANNEETVDEEFSRPSSSNQLTIPARSRCKMRTTINRKHRRRLGKPTKSKNTFSKATPNNPNNLSDTDREYSGDEYALGDDLFATPKRDKCRCQAGRTKFPNGRDGSWEKTAPLNHGSYIRFGCIEFIFSIVDYPAPSEERSCGASKSPSPQPDQPEPELEKSPPRIFIPSKKDDLSLKLISILNVLSSKTSSKSSSPPSSPSNVSSVSSPFSSRSSSPIMQNGTTSDNAESRNYNFNSRDHSDDGKIEITG